MSVDKFKFVSPGVFIHEIDESILEPLPEKMGPLVIGRFQKGPANRPTKVSSFREFVSIFGYPSSGNSSGDIWRTGEMTAPTYAAYAVQAWLKNNSPCTVYRCLGEQRADAEPGTDGESGWSTTNTFSNGTGSSIANAGGAYGLFIMPNPDLQDTTTTSIGTEYLLISGTADSGDAWNFAGPISGTLMGANYSFYVPYGAGAELDKNTTTIHITSSHDADGVAASPAAGQIFISGSSNLELQSSLIAAINGTAADDVTFGSGRSTGVLGITATSGSGLSVTLTATKAGVYGSQITITGSAGLVTQGGTLDVGAATHSHIEDNPSSGGTNSLFSAGPEAAGSWALALTASTAAPVTGTLAAIWYVNAGAVVLTGTQRNGQAAQGCHELIKGTNGNFTAKIYSSDTTVEKAATFNFDRDSNFFIRKVFNTDPTKINDEVTVTGVEQYWLGETFESNLKSAENSQLKSDGSEPSSTGQLGVILALDGTTAGSGLKWHDRAGALEGFAAKTGWFFSQDLRGTTYADFDPTNTSHVSALFRFVALDSGESANKDIKISIQDIQLPSSNFNAFGTFTVLVRSAWDSDNAPVILERYSNMNLDPTSTNYIAKVIGDRYYTFDNTNKTLLELGNYPNKSRYVRVVMNENVQNGAAKDGWLPFGVYGPVVPKTIVVSSGSAVTDDALDGAWFSGRSVANAVPFQALAPAASTPSGVPTALQLDHVFNTDADITASLEFPTSRMRVSSSEGGLVLGRKAYFGYQSNIIDTKRHDGTTVDLLRSRPAAAAASPFSKGDDNQYSWVFTLDNIVPSVEDSSHAVHVVGGRASMRSYTAVSSSDGKTTKEVLLAGYNRFNSPMFGGQDGFDITEPDPFRNSFLDDTPGEKTNYAYYSLKKAVDMTADAEFIEYDLACMPGITNSSLNTALVNSCEERGDALAIVDLPGGYTPAHENLLDEASRLGTVQAVVDAANDLGLNSSYGCTFYPYVMVRDTIDDSVLYVPPSVVALGTFSSSQRKSAVWFAPAGFTRGGLSEGSAGLPVLGVRQRLTSDDRDKLYEANINPIASFPAEGIVIFGQKTLQVTQSALDRINVRRLMIHVKKEISRFAATTLFEQNITATWDRFKNKVIPFLERVKAGKGLTDFKVLLDSTTTTPDLVDRNILYAKIYLKPARAIEFIALDFIITKSGASFDD